MKVGVLTSSRADFGIYSSLLKRIQEDSFFDLEIIAFGTHLSKFHGYTVEQIVEARFPKIYKIASLLTNDDEHSISTAYGLTALKFSDFWADHMYDWVLCLGDRFEMAAAVQAGIPYDVNFAHLHGGETTLGAIDNIYRHQITLAAKLHFPATQLFAERIIDITGNKKGINVVGSLSIDEIGNLNIPDEDEFRNRYNIQGDFILITFHPETVSPERNRANAKEMYKALKMLSKNMKLVITMPNADTYGTIFRANLLQLKNEEADQVILIETFGKLNYFAAMRYCTFLLGNTSSGIIEAASFGKYVINVGDRQKGRAQSGNVVNTSFDAKEINHAALSLLPKGRFAGVNIYYRPGTARAILESLKNFNNEEL
ncbi:GDP/UDP-N,N'-diacetylbacillosamine 2-epimerase (hydrolysing) [Anseongella ginsenosidimutans]|uniref:GDP/UDP-N,N'-diacetylbacillosamine 2-epimerase (Hydrolysing) n=1 Tax=Anseongella ginsenosidimutans TaxID=496056 RepID=A0A4R3KL98_9SPHI|nr:UDP-N-acetylglucosamine 2-epimerase [Anseongella ginsenosidimutans]QEC52135.1 UDP-N-acetylglucosamine 2-epimerase (hydrolyzing) [Anseongella ginsenosidimutans]TCS84836.1 GDP/UDP-N,N'-diacetylbacillosamine 2-epimerase (hydrolysing) [Anseongella ginsenosidimutans]